MTVSRIALLTSGGDAPGMNTAIRAVTRAALDHGVPVYGVHEGYEGLVRGGSMIQVLDWNDVGGILQQGGTILGTARSEAFRKSEGRLAAARHLVELGIDGLVVIGGDGSLSGADLFSREWPSHLQTLRAEGAPGADSASDELAVIGLPGSIDNDLYGTDMSIGVDTALRNIVQALDALSSTAASHQRTFVVETMGRNCGYLALYSSLAGAGSWVLIPEQDLERRWAEKMGQALQAGNQAGRRHAMVIVAEGARHNGLPIGIETLRQIMTQRLGVEARATVLGHVQRGGAPSTFDRILATRLGVAAVDELVNGQADPPRMIGLRSNRVATTPLTEVVSKSRAVNEMIEQGEYDTALKMRGTSFREILDLASTLSQPNPEHEPAAAKPIAIMTAGADAPGMNAVVRVAVRLALNAGKRVLGVHDGFQGFVRGRVEEMTWRTVSNWSSLGGTQLGASRYVPTEDDWDKIAQVIQQHDIGGLLVIGGWTGYQAAFDMQSVAASHRPLRIPIVCVPATINNNLPATDFTIGSDTALNTIVEAVDKIKTSAFARNRIFIVEVMGRTCGFLALMSGIATGAEIVYLPEEGISLERLMEDSTLMKQGFSRGKRRGIVINCDGASRFLTTDTIQRLLEEDGGEMYEARAAILGHLQRGGAPSPFDRIQGSRMAARAVRHLLECMTDSRPEAVCIGLRDEGLQFTSLADAVSEMDIPNERPRVQWWLSGRDMVRMLAQPKPDVHPVTGPISPPTQDGNGRAFSPAIQTRP
ncbi:MAG: 6-phosphofructokinase [Anaerolineae bacterium]|nr:6-phosphofructokinase [Anaerolineae bacterium]